MTVLKKVCIAYLGNPLHDTRIMNLRESLTSEGFGVRIIGFDWLTPGFEPIRNDDIVILKLRKTAFSILFYLTFKLKLLRELFNTNADIYFAEDIYTLPFVKVRSLFGKSKIYYNSRELYAFLGGHRNRRVLQKIMTSIERFFIKHLDLVLTTGEMDSKFLEDFYGIKNTLVIRNIPKLQQLSNKINLHEKLKLDSSQKILLYQGVLIDGRGVELLINQLDKNENAVFVLLGAGEKQDQWEELARNKGLVDRVFFLGSIPQDELINYTAAADIGICLIENISVSYYHALPNKLFEYIMAGLPVISSDLPQMKQIVEQYEVGKVIDIENDEVVESIKELLSNAKRLNEFKYNCRKAAEELNWDVEFEKVKERLIGSK